MGDISRRFAKAGNFVSYYRCVSSKRLSDDKIKGSDVGLRFSLILSSADTGVIGSTGEYPWRGAAVTAFWIGPVAKLIVIFLTQFMPNATFNFHGQLKTIIYPALP